MTSIIAAQPPPTTAAVFGQNLIDPQMWNRWAAMARRFGYTISPDFEQAGAARVSDGHDTVLVNLAGQPGEARSLLMHGDVPSRVSDFCALCLELICDAGGDKRPGGTIWAQALLAADTSGLFTWAGGRWRPILDASDTGRGLVDMDLGHGIHAHLPYRCQCRLHDDADAGQVRR